ncbi:VOC family protein [Variovorax sp. DXTD-1]|uniref:VOC family protein n=1 Tax=Variovorax sp. DXTD-1 TaxID=2495592 RepID=UPI000F88332A|nr:VOC family protein [Variovorax sp. DXTD-1]RST49141.1 VOC family protein [Variovorax sp. DXTD-1]
MQAYLTFNGNAAEALAFYAKALGGKVIFSMTFGESPMGAETPEAYKGKIMHATLEARGHQLMASDMPPGIAFEGYKGFSLSVQGNNVDEGKKLFEALAEGGEVTMPYGPQFWAVGFGMLTDKFGVPWMVNCEK